MVPNELNDELICLKVGGLGILKMNVSVELSKFEAGSKEYKFFEKIFEKLGANFIRKSVKERQREVQCKLNKATEKYFELHILLNALMKSAEQSEMYQDASQLAYPSETSSCVHSLYYHLVKNYLPPQESQKPKIFGLCQEKVLSTEKMKKSESEKAAFKQLVEDNINDFCKQLIFCTGTNSSFSGDWISSFDMTMKNLESKITIVSSKEIREQSKKQLRAMIKTYYEELSKRVKLLSKTLSLHEQKLEYESDLSDFYLQRCHAVFLKIKYCELQILQSTYNKETMPALRKISGQLDRSEEKLKEDQNEKTVALESYLKLGEEYEHIVEEYTNLTKSIKEQQWAIDELKSKKSQYCAYGYD